MVRFAGGFFVGGEGVEKDIDDLGFAKVDLQRERRQGIPEAVYAAGKTKEQVLAIMQSLAKSRKSILASRADRETYEFVRASLPQARYNETARIIYIEGTDLKTDDNKRLLILTAGTSDLPVAEEARQVAELLGHRVTLCSDVGVAGIHRLFAHIDEVRAARVIIVVAGMDGALASVVGGLTDKPVIAVPTSIGYGASFGGVSALLSMINSCASGLAVMNIDNGFGAAVLADKIFRAGQV